MSGGAAAGTGSSAVALAGPVVAHVELNEKVDQR